MPLINSEIPKLHPSIIEAIDNNKFAIFIGAGISRLVECSSWGELSRKYIKLCVEKGLIDHKDKETLEGYPDNRKVITIVYELLKSTNCESEFHQLMREALQNGSDKKTDIYSYIVGLSSLIVTTNADNFLNSYYSSERIVANDFHPNKIDRTKLFKIHGTIDEQESLIFTLPSYFNRYGERGFQEFLVELFSKYTILFVGYGLAEFELLEFLFSRIKKPSSKEIRHFILLDFYEGEDARFKLESIYYKHLGIEIIPYCKNKNGYNEIQNIFERWAKEISITTSVIPNTISELDNCFLSPNKEKIDTAIQLIANNIMTQDYFWQNISSKDPKGEFLEALNEKGYFKPALIPIPKEDPIGSGKYYVSHWRALDYLNSIAISVDAFSPKMKLIEKIIGRIINETHTVKIDFGKRNRLADWRLSELILNLPINKISDKHLKFIREISLQTENFMVSHDFKDFFIKRLLPSQNDKLLLKFLAILFSTIENEKGSLNTVTLVDKHTIQELAKALPNHLNQNQIILVSNYIIEKIKKHYKSNAYKFFTLAINTVEENKQNLITDKYEYSLVRLLRDLLMLLPNNSIKPFINKLTSAKVQILKRILFHTINIKYSQLKNVLWKWEGNPLNEPECKHELYELLKSNNSKFSNKEANILLTWITGAKYPKYKGINRKDIARYNAVFQREWLSAIETDDFVAKEKVKKFLDEIQPLAPTNREHPGYYSYFSSSSGIAPPSISSPIWKQENVVISNFVLDSNNWGDYNQDSIISELQNAIKENPRYRSASLSAFDVLQLKYKVEILYAFFDCTKKTIDIDVVEVIGFVERAINSNEFKESKTKEQNWFLATFSWFLREVFKNDAFLISAKLLMEIENILLKIIKNTKSDLELRNNDFVLDVINSLKGKLYEAFIELNLRNARQTNISVENKWMEASFKYLNEIITEETREAELQYLFGAYLPNFLFLNKGWVKEKFDQLFPLSDEKNWNYAFSSYLYFTGQVYVTAYNLFRDNKHLDFALTYYKEKENITDRLIQQICVMYNEGVERLDDSNSLINKIILSKNSIQINYLISFYLYLPHKSKEILPLWEKLLSIAESLDLLQKSELYKQLLFWIEAVPEINDTIKLWLQKSIDNLNEKVDYRFFNVLLSRFDEAPENVGQLYEYLIKSDKENQFMNDRIIKLVEGLYLKGFTDLANSISLQSMAKSNFTLKTIYDKYSKSV